MIDYCWQCGAQLENFSNGGNYYQSASPTEVLHGGADYDHRNQAPDLRPYQNNYAPKYQPRASQTNYGRIALVLGGIFTFLFLVSGVGAAVMYKIFLIPQVRTDDFRRNRKFETVKPTEPVKTAPTDNDPKKVESKTTSAKFEKMWVDYNVKEGGRLGMRIHVKFTVANMKDVDSYMVVHFEKEDGTQLKTTNRKFASKDGQVSVYRSMKPGYDETVYKDFDVFMPYDELN